MTQFHSQRHLVAINDTLKHEYQRGDVIQVQVDGFTQEGTITKLYFVDLIFPVYKVEVNEVEHEVTETAVREWQSQFSIFEVA